MMDLVTFTRTLPKALRFLRHKAGRTQERVATEAGITASMVSNYERGKEKPVLDTLIKLLTALESDLGELHEALHILAEHWTPQAKAQRRRILQEAFYPTLDKQRQEFSLPAQSLGEEEP
jgi:transcriptional regulator with XRE-family HTH domain